MIGLGLLGQITVQLLKANGCKVLGTDLDPDKLALAKKMGADEAVPLPELLAAAAQFSDGRGVDTVIITASTSSNQPIIDAGEITAFRDGVNTGVPAIPFDSIVATTRVGFAALESLRTGSLVSL